MDTSGKDGRLPLEAFADINLDLEPRECLELAIRVEKSGTEFYRMMAEEDLPEGVRAFFLRLMGMEISHERIIRDMIKALDPSEPEKLPFDEHLTHREIFIHLRTLLSSKIFPHGFEFLAELDSYKNPADALAMALAVEERAILLYRSLSKFQMPYQVKSVLEQLVKEEERHIAQIREILKSLA